MYLCTSISMNMEEKNSQVIFDKNAVEFVTVAAEFCGFMERVSDMRCRDFVDKSLKLLPPFIPEGFVASCLRADGRCRPGNLRDRDRLRSASRLHRLSWANTMTTSKCSLMTWPIVIPPFIRTSPKAWPTFTSPSRISSVCSSWAWSTP